MRVYIPATFDMLAELAQERVLSARGGWGFAVTPALLEFYTSGDEEEIAHLAFLDAARASLRLLATGEQERFPHRRVVVSADIDDDAVSFSAESGESVVRLDPPRVNLDDVVCFHVDIAGSEGATAAAVQVVDAADLGDEDAELTVGDALDNFMAWYEVQELGALVELL
ncbi:MULTISPECIES: hypothetical protein [unclassified Corynebacterium]|uniref:DUF6912 family protein n=1 Tax=unclassified Corynebacterium TaxID=2624378 RepID=UPI003523CE33